MVVSYKKLKSHKHLRRRKSKKKSKNRKRRKKYTKTRLKFKSKKNRQSGGNTVDLLKKIYKYVNRKLDSSDKKLCTPFPFTTEELKYIDEQVTLSFNTLINPNSYKIDTNCNTLCFAIGIINFNIQKSNVAELDLIDKLFLFIQRPYYISYTSPSKLGKAADHIYKDDFKGPGVLFQMYVNHSIEWIKKRNDKYIKELKNKFNFKNTRKMLQFLSKHSKHIKNFFEKNMLLIKEREYKFNSHCCVEKYKKGSFGPKYLSLLIRLYKWIDYYICTCDAYKLENATSALIRGFISGNEDIDEKLCKLRNFLLACEKKWLLSSRENVWVLDKLNERAFAEICCITKQCSIKFSKKNDAELSNISKFIIAYHKKGCSKKIDNVKKLLSLLQKNFDHLSKISALMNRDNSVNLEFNDDFKIDICNTREIYFYLKEIMKINLDPNFNNTEDIYLSKELPYLYKQLTQCWLYEKKQLKHSEFKRINDLINDEILVLLTVQIYDDDDDDGDDLDEQLICYINHSHTSHNNISVKIGNGGGYLCDKRYLCAEAIIYIDLEDIIPSPYQQNIKSIIMKEKNKLIEDAIKTNWDTISLKIANTKSPKNITEDENEFDSIIYKVKIPRSYILDSKSNIVIESESNNKYITIKQKSILCPTEYVIKEQNSITVDSSIQHWFITNNVQELINTIYFKD